MGVLNRLGSRATTAGARPDDPRPHRMVLGWTAAACLVAGSVVFSAYDPPGGSGVDARDAASAAGYDGASRQTTQTTEPQAGATGTPAPEGSQPQGADDAVPATSTPSEPAGAPDQDTPGTGTGTGTAQSVPGAAAATDPDAIAGVLSRDVPPAGDGRLAVVPGAASAPGPGKVRTLKVSVEGGLPVDGQAFASFVLATLNDPRGWSRDGYAFARSDTAADTQVVLASPQTSERMCRPLQTMGTLSCRVGDTVVLTWYRWVQGHEDFDGDLTLYRQYLVNHEVGHSLGHGHQGCPQAGALAPVMMQQTKGVEPCLPNAWPYP